MKERYRLIAAVYLILLRNGQILMLRRFNTGYMDGAYSLPAGHVEPDESLRACLAREAKEEIGIILNSADLSLVHTIHRPEDNGRLCFFFAAEKWQNEPRNLEPEKCDAMQWFNLGALPKNMALEVAQALDCYQKKTVYSELNW